MDDDFPIYTVEGGVPWAPGVGVGSIDLRALASELSPRVTDPFIETADGTATRPPTAQVTAGPHRYSIIVPNQGENSWLNLGQADPNRINDTGMSGMSKTHIHFHKFDSPATIVALGGPTNHGWCSYKDTPLDRMQGYTMVTLGASYQESHEQTYIVSTDEDVVVRAAKKRILLKADAEDVVIEAAHYVSLGAKKSIKIVGDSGLGLDDPGYKTAITAELSKSFDVKAQKKAASIADNLQSIYGVLGSVIKLNGKEPVWKKFAWKPESWLDVVKGLADTGKLVASISRFVMSDDASGKVDIQAETYASLSADNAASIYGTMSASLTSLVSASVLGGTAGLKAAAWASVWGGISTSVKAGKDVTVEGEFGKAKLKGRADVSVSSTTAGVMVQGETDAQVTAGKDAYLYGKKNVYAAAGGATAYGLGASVNGLCLGKFTSGEKFESPAPEKKESFWVISSGLGATFKSGKIQLDDSKFDTKAGKVDIKATSGNVTVTGSKILLG